MAYFAALHSEVSSNRLSEELMSLVVAAAKTDKAWQAGEDAEAPHPQSARIRSARCPEKHSAYLLRRVLMSIKSCCRCKCPNDAGCLLHDAACCKNGNIIMRQTLNCRSYLCPEFGRATRVATATETVFVFEFSFAISICNWQKAERSRGKACGIVNALRCLPLVVASGWGWLGWRLSLSSAITIIISNNQRVVVATATECQMLRNACNITADCCGQSASHCCGAWGNNYN